MTISILASPDSDWEQLEEMLRDCFAHRGEVVICRCDLRQPLLHPPEPDTQAVFVIVDSMDAVTAARKTVYWDSELPLVLVCKNPDYALEAIRLGARDYLLQPVTPTDVQTASRRIFPARKEVLA